ncbi:protein arginine N-methyltransferase 9-like isoform X2 [Oscarella lobularis]|uniref:protein arginine N-methyltransferase 9-like isoform X2 n=1 Tax=Oscarella lobularis TaxID=121494 RepID=UPI0033139844
MSENDSIGVLRQARALFETGNLRESFALLCAAVAAHPNLLPSVETSIYRVYKALADGCDSPRDVCDAFQRAATAIPNSARLSDDMGTRLHSWGFHREALAHYRHALAIDSTFLRARDSLEGVTNFLVERWHYRMLNDIRRNGAYRRAIERAVNEYDCTDVLDIGCGTGILSMTACRAGARRVVACDLSKTMCDIAKKVFLANGMNDRIDLVHSSSNDIRLTEKMSLVVTEIVDAGLLGEGIVPTLRHAWKCLLAPNGRVIPAGATVYACLVECEAIRKQSRLCCELDVDGVTLIGSDYEEVSETGRMQREPYTSEKLNTLRGGFRELTAPVRLFRVDFSNPEVPLPDPVTVPVQIVRSGQLDAVVTWFVLHLDDVDELSTDTESESCWEQAVYPVPCAQTVDVLDGDWVDVRSSCTETRIEVTVVPKQKEKQNETNQVIFIPRDVLASLNDSNYQEKLKTALISLMSPAKGAKEVILDLSRSFPYACLQAIRKNGAECHLCRLDSRLSSLLRSFSEEVDVQCLADVLQSIKKDSKCIVLFDPVGKRGTLREGLLEKISSTIHSLVKATGSCPRVLPQKLTIFGTCLASPALRANSQVLGSIPTLGFDIARFVNEYQVTLQIDLDLTTLPHAVVTKPIPFISVDFLFDYKSPHWDHYKEEKIVTAMQSESITAIAFWYEICLADKYIINTGPEFSNSHFRQAALLLPEDLQVVKGDSLSVTALLRDSCIDFKVVKN